MKLKRVIACLTFLSVCCFGLGTNFAAEKQPIPIGIIASLTGYVSDQAQNLVEA